MYCIVCGYDISRSPDGRCSECGTRFRPSDSRTWSAEPGLLRRWGVRWPIVHRWIVETFTSVNCRCCGALLEGVADRQCPECGSHFDPGDMLTVLRPFRAIPRPLLRYRHIAPIRGVILPALLLTHGLHCIATRTAYMPARRPWGSFTKLHGDLAIALGVAWIGVAVTLHAHWFWNRVEPHWRVAGLPRMLGAMTAIGGLATLVALWIAQTFR